MLAADPVYLGLEWADWIVLAAYFLLILAVGLWSIRKVKDMADFFMGGRRFGPVFMMFFAFGSGTSSDQAVGVIAGTWRAGLAGIWWQFLWLWATPFYWIIAPVMRRMRALTTADYFEHRFGSSTALLYSIYGIIMSIVFIASYVYAAGKMVTALTGGELDRFSQQTDWQVPEIKWDSEKGWFGRGVLFHMSDPNELITELDAKQVPSRLTNQLSGFKKLSDDLRVRVDKDGEQWTLYDDTRDVNYPLRFVAAPMVDDQTEEDDGEARAEAYLQVRGSGWRIVEGYEFAILIMTFLFVLYGMAGGLGAAIITDFIQGLLTITFSFLLLPFVFQKIGGFGALHSEGEIRPGMFDLIASPEVAETLGKEPITIFYVIMLSITALTGIVVQPHIMGVCGAGKTEFEGRFGFTFGNFLKRICTVAWTLTGLACVVWYLGSNSPLPHADKPANDAAEFAELSPEEQTRVLHDRQLHADLTLAASPELQDQPEARRKEIQDIEAEFADGLFGRAAYEVLPTIAPGLVGLLLASLLAAVMSSGDAQMVVSSGLFTENIYRRYMAKNRSEKHYLWVGRLAGLIIVSTALVLQASFRDIINALQIVIKTPAAIGLSLWIGIMWRGWTAAAVWVSTLVSASAWALVAFQPNLVHDWGLPDAMFRFNAVGQPTAMTDAWQMVFYLSAGVLAGLITSFLTRRPPQEKLDHFFRLLHTPVKPNEEVPGPCQLPEDPLPPNEKLLNIGDIELPKPTLIGLGGFIIAWILAGLLVWTTSLLARVL
ncbi:sodium:solute symporter family protein [Thalassoroseus pseudoceratinae]|uniref:sodium:solute symporter family protein n=1 Tax=Thalassoroseus pseudoceratinae TaxID=2713176 RepID=UPI0014202D5E|nr:hypothetical protein [Thalassoroseus pseudoceratinae]